jgi:hypothetical protein
MWNLFLREIGSATVTVAAADVSPTARPGVVLLRDAKMFPAGRRKRRARHPRSRTAEEPFALHVRVEQRAICQRRGLLDADCPGRATGPFPLAQFHRSGRWINDSA